MEHRMKLFTPMPSHVYVSAHWTPGGWSVRIVASTPTRDCPDQQRRDYELLSRTELMDVVGAELAAVLQLTD